jgi:holo-[acyl-carrier protein] synthase
LSKPRRSGRRHSAGRTAFRGCQCEVTVGVDCEEIDRWRRLLSMPTAPDLRVFHAKEHAYCLSFADPAPHYAGRWCAKEAVVKALSRAGPLSVRDVAILSEPSGAPYVELSASRVRRATPQIAVSITHTARTALAVVVAVSGPDRECECSLGSRPRHRLLRRHGGRPHAGSRRTMW